MEAAWTEHHIARRALLACVVATLLALAGALPVLSANRTGSDSTIGVGATNEALRCRGGDARDPVNHEHGQHAPDCICCLERQVSMALTSRIAIVISLLQEMRTPLSYWIVTGPEPRPFDRMITWSSRAPPFSVLRA